MRFETWRNAKTDADRESARANAVHYAGVLGHYVADGTMPMHLSVHFNGWADGYANPKGFTTDRMFHSRYETAYVDAAINQAIGEGEGRRPSAADRCFRCGEGSPEPDVLGTGTDIRNGEDRRVQSAGASAEGNGIHYQRTGARSDDAGEPMVHRVGWRVRKHQLVRKDRGIGKSEISKVHDSCNFKAEIRKFKSEGQCQSDRLRF